MTALPQKITLNTALKMINAMIRFAKDNQIFPGSYAVVDEGGHVIAFERRDIAPIATADIAIDKAWTAATMKASGRMLEVITRGEGWRLNVKHKGRLTIIPGAIPIIAHGRILGGIGHSGGSAEEDLKISQAGWTAIFREEDFKEEVEEKLSKARLIAEEVLSIIKERNLKPVSVAVLDEWGGLLLLYRMDRAPYGTLELSRDKAWTAAAFKTFSDYALQFYNNNVNNVNWNERVTPVPGGVPFSTGETFCGAIGISGDEPEIDKEVAIEALKRLAIKVRE
ncbi:MAG: heme-binding protein [Desulfurococcales archaeon]|nr:heme-binding protein [Desulfurococcales archaeon]